MTLDQLNQQQLRILRAMLEDRITADKNHIASGVECGSAEYGKSGENGFEFAQKRCRDLRLDEGIFKIINGNILRAEGKL